MPNDYRDKHGHWTSKENDGGECQHDGNGGSSGKQSTSRLNTNNSSQDIQKYIKQLYKSGKDDFQIMQELEKKFPDNFDYWEARDLVSNTIDSSYSEELEEDEKYNDIEENQLSLEQKVDKYLEMESNDFDIAGEELDKLYDYQDEIAKEVADGIENEEEREEYLDFTYSYPDPQEWAERTKELISKNQQAGRWLDKDLEVLPKGLGKENYEVNGNAPKEMVDNVKNYMNYLKEDENNRALMIDAFIDITDAYDYDYVDKYGEEKFVEDYIIGNDNYIEYIAENPNSFFGDLEEEMETAELEYKKETPKGKTSTEITDDEEDQLFDFDNEFYDRDLDDVVAQLYSETGGDVDEILDIIRKSGSDWGMSNSDLQGYVEAFDDKMQKEFDELDAQLYQEDISKMSSKEQDDYFEKGRASQKEDIDYENIEYPKGTDKKYTQKVNKAFENAIPLLEKAGIKLEDFGGEATKEGGYEDNSAEIMKKYVFEPFRKKYPNGNNDVWEKEYQPLYNAISAVLDKNYNDWWIKNKR